MIKYHYDGSSSHNRLDCFQEYPRTSRFFSRCFQDALKTSLICFQNAANHSKFSSLRKSKVYVHDTTLRSQNAEQLRENGWLRCSRKPQSFKTYDSSEFGVWSSYTVREAYKPLNLRKTTLRKQQKSHIILQFERTVLIVRMSTCFGSPCFILYVKVII